MDQRDAALDAWYAARASLGQEPEAQRVARVREKLADPVAQLVVVERDGDTVGMALAEPFREGHGLGDIRARWGHISMVFVRPDHQGVGVGSELVQRLISEAPWPHLSVWTREANVRAQRLYRGCGFVATGESGSISGGEATGVWERLDLGRS